MVLGSTPTLSGPVLLYLETDEFLLSCLSVQRLTCEDCPVRIAIDSRVRGVCLYWY